MHRAASVLSVTAPDRSLVVLAGIALLEGLGLVAYALFDVVEAVRVGTSGPADVSNAPALILLVVITAAFGVGMIWVARGWWRAQRWARAPFILSQIIAVLIGYELAQSAGSAERYLGIGVALVGAVGLILSFAPGVSRAIDDEG